MEEEMAKRIAETFGADYRNDVNTMNTLYPQIEKLKQDIAYCNQYK